MASQFNFKGIADASPAEGVAGKPPGNHPLTRQPSIYNLTFDEFQNTWGGLGKDFGSMNMDELLKNIWTAEETQATTSSMGTGDGSLPGGDIQRQGSLTLPRTLSQKTVDEVWKDLLKESTVAKDGNKGGGYNIPQKQPTLGEMTLEEFLLRAGVVREDAQQVGRPNNSGFVGDFPLLSDSTGLGLNFQQPSRNNGFVVNHIPENSKSIPGQPPNLAFNVGSMRSNQQHDLPLLPKPATMPFASSINIANNSQLPGLGSRGAIEMTDASIKSSLVQGAKLQTGVGMTGLETRGVALQTLSPANHISPDVISKNTVDSSSLSPVPYPFSRGRKCSGALEKVVERRQRRMIKNRESAARSRARKQAYTMELEAEVEKLKELNQELQRKQEELVEMQKSQILEKVNWQWGGKRICLRRTLTGPW
ncbi:ABSCISIC ACID-INSENSITIVE 5-like protein 7 [Rhodamnia argentea]|uniref:ABSCISIC ACID-INSENSITIVE 5-like protein 7 n=1 Tax=Rhodamnia argentea TaxID=178133 RepID=A0A8B8NR77_9MYRT|nr:ABSCISIC ACID-INSENSITIVE 5-like protein 7 [Rhodamnia argentea]